MTRRVSVFLILAALVCVAPGCRRGKALAGPPSVGQGIRVELRSGNIRIKGNNVVADLLVTNETEEEVTIVTNQIAVVGPDGNDYYTRDNDTLTIRKKDRDHFAITVPVDGATFKQAPGLYLRFDGFYVGTLRVDVPPMPLGNPEVGPGNTNPAFAAPISERAREEEVAQAQPAPAPEPEKPGLFSRVKNAVLNRDSKSEQPAEQGSAQPQAAQPPPPAESRTMAQYNGPRRQVKNRGVKCAAMPLKTKDIASQLVFVMDELLLTELQQTGMEAIGPDDINAMIGFEKTKAAVGCDDMACISEIGNALGVEYLAAGNVSALEGSVVLTLKLIDVRNTKVLARVNRVAEGGQKGLPRMIAEAVQELVERAGI